MHVIYISLPSTEPRWLKSIFAKSILMSGSFPLVQLGSTFSVHKIPQGRWLEMQISGPNSRDSASLG